MKSDVTLISDALADKGYVVLTDAIAPELTQQLYQHVTSLPASAFNIAKVGRQQSAHQLATVRNDKTVWLSDAHAIEQAYLSCMNTLRMQLNEQLYLGLRDFEAHFSHYAPGQFYGRHVDAFKGQSNRIVSSVFYLNPDWSEQDEGQLLIYQPDSQVQLEVVMPQIGTLVLFLSEQFPHEVMPALRDRYSIAGWFRTDTAL